MPGIGPWLSISIFSIKKNVGLNLGLYAVGTRCLVVRINESPIHILQGTIQFQFHFHIGINIDYTKTLIPPWYDTSKDWEILRTTTSDLQDTCSIWNLYPQFLGSMIIKLDCRQFFFILSCPLLLKRAQWSITSKLNGQYGYLLWIG